MIKYIDKILKAECKTEFGWPFFKELIGSLRPLNISLY